ncbi:MAG: diaminopimelate epimerase [Bacteroidetes bacterium]|nr:MAG: diaminopimelate epimerase [Bacteroidota bacterium]
MQLTFYKYQGTGNDFIVLNNLQGSLGLSQEQIAALCRRRLGIGADGLMTLNASAEADFLMRYYNADGAEGSLCGNGSRCMVAFAHRLGLVGEQCSFMASDGLHRAQIRDGEVRLLMHSPRDYAALGEGQGFIDTGSPHYVQFVQDDMETLDVCARGRPIRYHQDFAARGGTNVNFVHPGPEGVLYVRTYERGVEDETLSCGTGITAAAYIYLLQSQSRGVSCTVPVHTRGGRLRVEVQQLGTPGEEVWLCGPATFVFEGLVEV